MLEVLCRTPGPRFLRVVDGRDALQFDGWIRPDDICGLDSIDPRDGTMSSFMHNLHQNQVVGPFATEGRRYPILPPPHRVPRSSPDDLELG